MPGSFFKIKINTFYCNHRVNIHVNWSVYIYWNCSIQENDTYIFIRRTSQDIVLQIRLCCLVCTWRKLCPYGPNQKLRDWALFFSFSVLDCSCPLQSLSVQPLCTDSKFVCTAQWLGSGQHRKQNCIEDVTRSADLKRKAKEFGFAL